MQFASSRAKGIVALVMLAWVFATMGVFARYLDLSFDLFEQTYLRIGLAFLFASILFYRHLDFAHFKSMPRKDVGVLIFRSICLYLAVVLITEAFLNTKYSNASFVATLPLLPVFGYLLLGETIKFRTILYIALGFVGFTLITVSDFASFSVGYGEMMAFGSMILFDLSYVGRRWHSNHLNNYESTVFMFAVGTVFLFTTSMLLGEGLPTSDLFTTSVIGVLIIASLFNVVNLYLTNYGFEHVKVAVAGNILTLEVVFALLYSLFLFQEVPILREIIGGALIVTSVYLVNKSEAN